MLLRIFIGLATATLLTMPLSAQDDRLPEPPRLPGEGGAAPPPPRGERPDRPPFPPREGEGRGPRDGERPRFSPEGGARFDDRREEAAPRTERRPMPYLGVVTSTAPAALATQLGLTEGFGLVVEEVLPDSPAQAAGLQRHDVLKLLGEQQLAAPSQLTALLRNAGKDQEVTLTLIRKTQEHKVTVKVGETLAPERPRQETTMSAEPFAPRRDAWTEGPRGRPEGERREGGRPADLLRELRPGAGQPPREPSGEGVSRWDASRARVTLRDREGELELSVKDGQRVLVAKNAQGEIIFSGPVDTPAQRDALPAPLRARLATLEARPQPGEHHRRGPRDGPHEEPPGVQ
jgi:hypothetical protein